MGEEQGEYHDRCQARLNEIAQELYDLGLNSVVLAGYFDPLSKTAWMLSAGMGDAYARLGYVHEYADSNIGALTARELGG